MSSSRKLSGRRKKQQFEVKVDEDTKNKIVKLAKSKKITQGVIIGTLIDMNERFDFFDQNWRERFNKAIEDSEINRYERLDDSCPALAFTTKDGFVCVIKPPSQKKLGNGKDEDMREVCAACKRVKGIIDENELFRQQVKQGTLVEIPACLNGAKLNDDGDKLYCQITGNLHTVEKCRGHDFRLKRSGSCGFFTTSKIQIKGVIKEVGPK